MIEIEELWRVITVMIMAPPNPAAVLSIEAWPGANPELHRGPLHKADGHGPRMAFARGMSEGF